MQEGTSQQIFKTDAPESAVKLYKSYVSVILKQHELVWAAFRAYGLLMAAMLASIAFLYKESVEKKAYCPTGSLKFILIIVAILGLLLAICWLLASINHWHWEDVKQRAALALEGKILKEPEVDGMFTRIYAHPVRGFRLWRSPPISWVTQFVIFVLCVAWLFASLFFSFCNCWQ